MVEPASMETQAPSFEIMGRQVSMPAVVRDASSATAVFLVPREGVAALLPGDAFTPTEAAPGMTQLVLGFVDYRDNDLGDYHEAMIVFFVRPRGRDDAEEGTFIYKLPVDQAFTCEAGTRIWGFPKTVEGIDIEYGDTRVRGTLSVDGERVFSLALPRVRVEGSGDEIEMSTYSYTDRPVHTRFRQSGAVGFADVQAVTLELGEHAWADTLRSLGLPSAPLVATWTEHMRGSFAAPQPLA